MNACMAIGVGCCTLNDVFWDLVLEHISMGTFEKMVLKQLYFAYLEQSREAKERELAMMGLLVA